MRLPRSCLAALLLAALPCLAAQSGQAPADVGRQLAQCAAPALSASNIEVDSGSGGLAIEALRERHWLELAGGASLVLRRADGRDLARVRVQLPAPGHYAQQQRWREHALLDAAARGGGKLRRLDWPGQARVVTLNKRAVDGKMEGKYVGLSLLSDAGRGVFVQWHWMNLEDYADGGALAAAQQAVLLPLLACLLPRPAGSAA